MFPISAAELPSPRGVIDAPARLRLSLFDVGPVTSVVLPVLPVLPPLVTRSPAEMEQHLIVVELQDTDDGLLSANIAAIWDSFSDKGALDLRLQSAYAKKRAAEMLMGRLRLKADFALGSDLQRKENQLFANARAIRQTAIEDIGSIEERLGASADVVLAQPTTTAPVSPPDSTYPDANDPRWIGDPYRPSWPRLLP